MTTATAHRALLAKLRLRPLVAAMAVGLVLAIMVATSVAQAADADQVERGSAVYAASCAVCHGPNLDGGLGPSLLSADLQTRYSTALDLFKYVRNNMPQSAPGSLGDVGYLDTVALILDRRGVAFEGSLTTVRAASIALGPGTPVETPSVAPTPVPSPTPDPPPPAPATGNRPPAKPTLWDPVPTRQRNVVSPYFLNFQTSPFADPDLDDTHRATQFEVWSPQLSSRVWSTTVTHPVDQASLASGTFEGPLAGHLGLLHHQVYAIRARHQDDSRDAASEWAAWSDWRYVLTARPGRFIGPMRVRDIQPNTLTWVADDGSPVVLAPGNSLLLTGSLSHLHRLEGTDAGNLLQDVAPAGRYVNLFFHFRSDGGELIVPPSRISFLDATGVRRTIWLPFMRLAQGRHLNAAASAQGDFYFEGDYIPLNEREAEPALFTLVRVAQDPWRVAPGFRAELVTGGLHLPTQIAVVPDPSPVGNAPYAYVTEYSGAVKAIGRDGAVWTYADGILNFAPDEPPSAWAGQLGTSGIAVQPGTGDVFVSTVYLDGDTFRNKIVRFISEDGGRTAARQTDVLRLDREATGPSHHIHGLLFGHDGMLYVAVGDGSQPGRGLHPDAFGGKILRLRPDGRAPPDNPFFDPAHPTLARSYEWASGLRNVFALAQRAGDPAIYGAENGPSLDRVVRFEPGTNIGSTGWDGAMLATGLWFFGPPAHAPTGVAFAEGGNFPARLQGQLLVGAFGRDLQLGTQDTGEAIGAFPISPDGTTASRPQAMVKYVGSGYGTVTGIAYAPDGLLFAEFFADDPANNDPFARTARVWRVVADAVAQPR